MAGTLTLSTLSDGVNSTSSTNAIRGSAKAFVNFDGSTLAIRGSYNVSSITSGGTGNFYVNLIDPVQDLNYTGVVSASGAVNGQHCGAFLGTWGSNDTTAFVTTYAFQISVYNASNSGLRANPVSCCVAIFR